MIFFLVAAVEKEDFKASKRLKSIVRDFDVWSTVNVGVDRFAMCMGNEWDD